MSGSVSAATSAKAFDLLDVIDRCCDALPPAGGAESRQVGPFELFTNPDPGGWPYYARPRRGAASAFTDGDVVAVRTAQVELGVPEAIEWIHEIQPSLVAVVERNGMSVVRAPLLALDTDALPSSAAVPGADLALLDPGMEGFAAEVVRSRAVAEIAFSGREDADERAREEVAAGVAPSAAASGARRLRSPAFAEIVARSGDHGIVGSGALQSAGGVAEIVGVAALPAYQGLGIGSAITIALAEEALRRGNEVVFLSAGSPAAARIYERVGFRRIGTACVAEPPPH